jgi:hypothetical protein
MFAARTQAQSVVPSPGTAAVSNDLLRDSEKTRQIDVQWVLRDDRSMLQDGASPAEHAPVAMKRTPNLDESNSQGHVGTPADDPASVNDRLVPVPVVNTGSAIALSAILFTFGRRVLRIRRATSH